MEIARVYARCIAFDHAAGDQLFKDVCNKRADNDPAAYDDGRTIYDLRISVIGELDGVKPAAPDSLAYKMLKLSTEQAYALIGVAMSSYEAVSGGTMTPLGTIKSRLHRARHVLINFSNNFVEGYIKARAI